jgi:hypothetical protein
LCVSCCMVVFLFPRSHMKVTLLVACSLWWWRTATPSRTLLFSLVLTSRTISCLPCTDNNTSYWMMYDFHSSFDLFIGLTYFLRLFYYLSHLFISLFLAFLVACWLYLTPSCCWDLTRGIRAIKVRTDVPLVC